MERGYIKLWRCIKDNPFWDDKPFDRGRAWVDLLLIANHERTCLWKRGVKIIVERGQVGWSERQLSERWGWSRGKVRRFLNDLKNELQIVPQNGPQNLNVTSLITIVNYDKYQKSEPRKEPQTVPQTGHRRATDSTIENEFKNEKNKTTTTVVTKFSVQDVQNLMAKYLGLLMPNSLQINLIRDICDSYTPNLITEAFQAACAAKITNLGWVIKRLENKKPAISRTDATVYVEPEMSTKLQAIREQYEL